MSQTTTRDSAVDTLLPESIREEFPILETAVANGLALAYLDNAATTQKPRCVLDAMTDYYTTSNSNVGRGYYQLSMQSSNCLEQARGVVQAAIGAEAPGEVMFTRGTTDAMNLVADTLGRQVVHHGDRV